MCLRMCMYNIMYVYIYVCMMLQVMQSRASERRWEQDGNVVNCTDCGKKFSVSVRRVS